MRRNPSQARTDDEVVNEFNRGIMNTLIHVKADSRPWEVPAKPARFDYDG